MGLRWYVEAPVESSRARLVMLEINMCILCVSLVTFEIKSIFNDKLEYFKSFWNLNDVTLFIMSILCLVLEYKNFKYQQSLVNRELADPAPTTTALTAEEEALANAFDYKAYYLAYDPIESTLRVCYSILIINTHIKTLNVLSFYESVAFILRAMESVFLEIRAFAVFYLFVTMVFALAFNALEVIYYNPDVQRETGDYSDMGGLPFAAITASYRSALGDFSLSNFKFLGFQKAFAWIVWLA